MTKSISSFFVVAALAGTVGNAQAELTANLGLASDYMWRGVSQTMRDPAVSGGLDYSHGSGLFIGTWASNIDFGDGDEYELDLYVGYADTISEVDYSITLNYYMYPDNDDIDFTELLVDVSYGIFSAGIAYTIDSEVKGEGPFNQDDKYAYVGLSHEIAEGWTLAGTVGHYDFFDEGFGGAANYTHGQIDLTRALGRFGDVTLTLSKTDEGQIDDNLLGLVSWTKTFSLN